MRALIYEHAGGIKGGKALKGVIPGGTSSAVLTPDEIDTPITVDALAALGSMAGSGAVIVLDEDVCMVKALHNIECFFAHESCGQCTPCRAGTSWVYKILSRIIAGNGQDSDLDTLRDFTVNMSGTSICALCEGAVMALNGFITKYEEEFIYFIREKTIPG